MTDLFPTQRPPLPRTSPLTWQLALGALAGLALGAVASSPLVPLPGGTFPRVAVSLIAAGAAVGLMAWLEQPRGPRSALRFGAVALVAWGLGVGAGLASMAARGPPVPAGPPPDGRALQEAYWNARMAPIEVYAREIDALYPARLYPEIGEGRDLGQARDKLARARAALARARAAGDQAALAVTTGEQLRRLGRDRFDRQMIEGAFRQQAAEAEEVIADLWRQETERLDASSRVLDLLDQWRGHWRHDARGFVFNRPDDTRAFTAAAWRINVAEIRTSELRRRLGQIRSQDILLQARQPAP